jgi:hypothetical protein
LRREAGQLQEALLPPVPEALGAVRATVAYRAADGPGAGGDFYDALTLPHDRAAFILGDVSGHGEDALAQTAFMRFTLRAYLEAGLEPREVLRAASPVIGQHLDGHFATAVVAIHDPVQSALVYACAGHPPPIVVGPERPEPVLVGSSPPIGIGMRTGLRQTTLPLRPGAVVCLYTDGMAEARTALRILGRPRLGDLVAALGPTATASDLLHDVAAEARLVTDDMAAVLIRPRDSITAGGPRREQIEVDLDDAANGLVERFLEACKVGPAERARIASEAGRVAHAHGTALVDVRLEPGRPVVEIEPLRVMDLQALAESPLPVSPRPDRS